MARITEGTSLVSGIQDISAFLPIIGTDQCERHVGEALDRGYLYAAAAPLSMFGSLGIVKASTAILVASFSPRSAQMLVDAGFKLQGSVAAMLGTEPSESRRHTSKNTDNSDAHKDHSDIVASIGMQPSRQDTWKNTDDSDTSRVHCPEYTAAGKLRALLVDQHIDLQKSKVNVVFDYACWNWGLCVSAGLLSCLSIIPYIGLIRDSDPSLRSFPAWAPPLMRILGSAISVVVAQMVIQCQIQEALKSMLDGTTLRSPTSDIETGNHSTRSHSETGIDWDSTTPSGPLNRPDSLPENMPLDIPPPSGTITSRICLAVLQLLLFIGIGATAIGYLGCFTVVQNAPADSTYMWLGIEITLALLRIYIWSLNPSWDEVTGVTLGLQLPDNFEQAPKITTPYNLPHPESALKPEGSVPFVILTDSEFLEYVSPYTGPVERF
ncbi:hypothetical protein B0H16DRAFT_1793718 [Mycena metata]|uniref:Uncharacterized protein n=1 Tax=Mycena metata TaxID=1033252 RepID=A0AAD7HH49_9AGAR|nr:hypothetical protein B0H16DRAFT_1793718 [Mycena metata]